MTIEENIFDKGGSVRTKELLEDSPNPYYGIRKAIANGSIARIKKGVYMLTDELADTMIDVETIIPGGVLCLFSAWSYHRLSTQIPTAFYVAIDTHRRVVVPDYPSFTLCYWLKKYCELGSMRTEISGHSVLITDLEKSVCDAVKFRNKIGLDVCAEIFHNYLAMPEKNISRLFEYAGQMRIKNTLKTYLQMWR